MTPSRLIRSESGAILIQVGLSIVVLTAFCAFVLDYGVMWAARRQAQNSADAGALAGAIARAFDETTDPPAAGGVAEQAAIKTATANQVWQQTPAASVTWTCPGFVTGSGCVRVDVHRDGTNGSNVLPTYFAPLLGISTQGVQATASAQAAIANASNCMRPFGIPDKWQENNPAAGAWTSTSVFDRYVTNGKNAGNVLSPADAYTAPSASGTGTGFTLATDYGTAMTLKFGNPNGSDPIQPGWYLPIDLPRASGGPMTGGARYRANIDGCNGQDTAIGDFLPTETGAKIGPTKQGIQGLIDQDPNASWNATTQKVQNSCAPGCAPYSPRIVALPVFNPDQFQLGMATNNWSSCPSGGTCVQVVNILGFFIAGLSGSGDVSGYLMTIPGERKTGGGSITGGSSFSKFISLVR